MSGPETRQEPGRTLRTFIRDSFVVEADPPDPAYQSWYTVQVVDGFRILSLIICFTMAAMLLVHIIQWGGPESYRRHQTLSVVTCTVLALSGAIGSWLSKAIQSRAVARLAAAGLLGAAIAALTMDRLSQAARDGVQPASLIPVIFILLMLGTTVMLLRPENVLGLGVILLLICTASVAIMRFPLQGDFVDLISACAALAVSVVIAARSTSHRLKAYYGYTTSIEATKQTEEARSRALLAESAVTMERLAASLSHELNTPIGALKSATDTLTRGVEKYASFPTESAMPELVGELANAIKQSAARLSQTVARIQRFANLDRSTINLTDVNQLIQDAVALMNPPSAHQAQVVLNLEPMASIWCRPQRLSVALASILNTAIEGGYTVSIETHATDANVIAKVTLTGCDTLAGPQVASEPGFGVRGGRVRATGWDLFAARQLVGEIGGDLRIELIDAREQTIMITLPTSALLPEQKSPPAAAVSAA